MEGGKLSLKRKVMDKKCHRCFDHAGTMKIISMDELADDDATMNGELMQDVVWYGMRRDPNEPPTL